MGRLNSAISAFNRGLISPLALARTDIPRIAMSATVFSNWMPRVLGSMMLRPGFGYVAQSKDNERAFHIPFVYATDDTAAIQVTNENLRVLVNDVAVTRLSVSTAVTNGDFSNAAGWTDIDEGSAVSTITGAQLELVGTNFASAGRKQTLTISGTDSSIQHALRIVVERGTITFRLGTTDGGDDIIAETTLGAGVHSLAFTPDVTAVYFQFTGLSPAKSIVSSCEIEAIGVMDIDAPWAESDLGLLRYDQSADVIYIACEGYQTRKIERRGINSWSLVKYEPVDGPFRVINTSTIDITPSGISGDITLTASRALFRETHIGALFKITSIGQVVEQAVGAENVWSDEIRIQGVGSSQRSFDVAITGTWSGTVTLQRSVGEVGSWIDISTYAANTTTSYNDGLDNQIIFYRIGIRAGDYTSGTAEVSLTYANGNVVGIARVTDYTDEKIVNAAVLKNLGSTDASFDWQEGTWSDRRGHPSSLALNEGRLNFAGKTKFIASISDAYESFDEDQEGDSAPLNRSIGQGPIDDVNWLLALTRIIIGTAGAEWNVRSSSLDEPLTASNFSLKAPSTQGSAKVAAVKIDDSGMFVHRDGTKLYQLNNSADVTYGQYQAIDLTEIVPEIGHPSIVRLAVQRQPDTRIHCVRGDGKVAVLVNQPAEDVLCWLLVETDGFVEDAYVLPGLIEDKVYYMVRRTINGVTRRYLERWALESECQGDAINKLADSHIVYDGVSTNTITGLDHLEGEDVVVWADGLAVSGHTVSSGSITLDTAAEQVVVGLYYKSDYKSTKLAYAAKGGTALTQKKKVDHLGLILHNTHQKGLKYGRDFDNLDTLPSFVEEKEIDENKIHETYDLEGTEFNGNWDTDSRLCLRAEAPYPCTVLATVIGINTNG